jgi:hypothetical protein
MAITKWSIASDRLALRERCGSRHSRLLGVRTLVGHSAPETLAPCRLASQHNGEEIKKVPKGVRRRPQIKIAQAGRFQIASRGSLPGTPSKVGM